VAEKLRAAITALRHRLGGAVRPAESLRGSELVMVLYRTALILSLGFSPWVAAIASPYGLEGLPLTLYYAIAGAFLYNSLLYFAYRRQFWRSFRRPMAVAVDLLLITLWIWFGRGTTAMQFLPLYYFEVLVASVWFGLAGGLSAATAAIVLFAVIVIPSADPLLRVPRLWLTHMVPYTYLVALLGGLLAQEETLGRRRLEEQRLVLEQFRQEIEVAQRIQRQTMPADLPAMPGFELGVAWRAAGPTLGLYGGDLYGVRALGSRGQSHRYQIFVGDVAGKGVMALVNLPVLTRTLEAVLDEESCERTMTRANQLLYQFLRPASFASLFYAHLDAEMRTLTYVNAGSVPPVLVRADGSLFLLEPGGPALGARPNQRYREESLELEAGDVLVIFTDGVTTTRNAEGEEFGEARVAELVTQSRALSAQHIADRLQEAASRFQSGEQIPDDITILVIKGLQRTEPLPPGD